MSEAVREVKNITQTFFRNNFSVVDFRKVLLNKLTIGSLFPFKCRPELTPYYLFWSMNKIVVVHDYKNLSVCSPIYKYSL